MNWGKNTYLKDPNTLTILPAPPETREEGIAWYEVQVSSEDQSVRLAAFDQDGADVERTDVALQSSDDDSFRFRSIFSRKGQQTNIVDYTVTKDSNEEVTIIVKVDDDEISIKGQITDPDSITCSRRKEIEIPNHWGRIADPLSALAYALSFRAITANSWSCEACIVLGGSILIFAAFCADGVLPACPSALAGGAAYYENCRGACAEEESG